MVISPDGGVDRLVGRVRRRSRGRQGPERRDRAGPHPAHRSGRGPGDRRVPPLGAGRPRRRGERREVLGVIEDVAYHDGSTGWCVMIAMTTGLPGAFLPEERESTGRKDRDRGFAPWAGTTLDGGGLVVRGVGVGSGAATAPRSAVAPPHRTTAGPSRGPMASSPPSPSSRAGRLLDTWHVMGCAAPDRPTTGIDAVPEGGGRRSRRPRGWTGRCTLSFFGMLALGVASVAPRPPAQPRRPVALAGGKVPRAPGAVLPSGPRSRRR